MDNAGLEDSAAVCICVHIHVARRRTRLSSTAWMHVEGLLGMDRQTYRGFSLRPCSSPEGLGGLPGAHSSTPSLRMTGGMQLSLHLHNWRVTVPFLTDIKGCLSSSPSPRPPFQIHDPQERPVLPPKQQEALGRGLLLAMPASAVSAINLFHKLLETAKFPVSSKI